MKQRLTGQLYRKIVPNPEFSVDYYDGAGEHLPASVNDAPFTVPEQLDLDLPGGAGKCPRQSSEVC